jgi:site-specific DNA recombinase
LPRPLPPHNSSEQPRRPVSWCRTPRQEWTSIPVPAILDEALFEAVQEQLRENQQRYRLGRQGAKYLLQGLVVCGGCGYALCGHRNGKRLYYRCACNVANRFSKQHSCSSLSVRGEPLEAAVWADVSALLAEPQRIADEYRRRLNLGDKAHAPPNQDKLQTQTRRVQRQISKLIDAYSEGLIDKNEFEPRIRGARQQLEKLRSDLRSQEQVNVQIHEMRLIIGQLETFAQRVRGSLEMADWATRRQLITTLVKRIEVGQEEIRVVYRVNCGPFELAPARGHVQDCWRRRSAT